MRTVLLVGAGASLSQAQSFRPQRTRDHPPLDATFFGKALEFIDADPDVASLRLVLASTERFYDPWEASNTYSLEQFFADVYYEVATGRSSEAFDILKALLRLYIRVLGGTTNWMAIRRDEGSLGDLIRHEIDTAAPDPPTVITFNQDLVIENIVARLPRVGGRWCLRGLFEDADLRPLTGGDSDVFPHHRTGCIHKAPIRLLKLHGSLNWHLRTREAEPRLGTLFPARRDKPVYLTDLREASLDVLTVETQAERGRHTWFLWPLIVPPIYDKHRITGMSVLQGMWDQAQAAIESADRLVLVGYSLPEADVLARQMLRRGFTTNPRLFAVYCINPDADMAGKLKANLDCRAVHLFHDIDDYLEFQRRVAG